MKNLAFTPKKTFFIAIYSLLFISFIAVSLKIYHEYKGRSSKYTAILPVSQTPEEFISSFYNLYNKDPSSHAKLVKNYSSADFQKKYNNSKHSDLLLCGNKPTPTFNVAKAYKNTVKDNNIVYGLNLVYPSYGSQDTVFIDVYSSGYSYQIKDVICTTDGGVLKH